MGIKNFKEKQIRDKILNKIKPTIQRGQGKHNKGYIYLDGVLLTKVKIPNSHDRLMKPSKSQYIAQALKISEEEFNDLIDCPLTGPKYYEKLKKWHDNL
jgi:hypothetical protein